MRETERDRERETSKKKLHGHIKKMLTIWVNVNVDMVAWFGVRRERARFHTYYIFPPFSYSNKRTQDRVRPDSKNGDSQILRADMILAMKIGQQFWFYFRQQRIGKVEAFDVRHNHSVMCS